MAAEESPWEDELHVLELNSTEKSFLDYLGLVTDYSRVPLGAVAILADILIIIVILKYKRLKNRSNFYILNFAAFHICYIVSMLLYYLVFDMLYNSELEVHCFCIWIRVEKFAMGLLLSFAAGFGIDAFFEKLRPNWFSKYEQRYFYAFSFLYFSHFIICVTAISVCLKNGFSNNFNLYFLTIYNFILFAVILYLIYREQKMEEAFKLSTPNKAYALSISAVILLCWLPLFIFYNLLSIFKIPQKVEHVLLYLEFLPEYVAYSSSLITMYKLWISNKHFKVAFRKILKRPVPQSEYEELNMKENGERLNKP